MIKYSNLKKNEIEEFRSVLEKCHMLQDFNDRKIVQKYLLKHPGLIIVAKDHDKIVGTIMGQGAGSILGSLWSISVLPEYRGKGVGSELVRKMSSRLVKKYKCSWIYLLVRESNPAIDLYKNLGFISDKIHSYGIWGENLKKLIS